MPQISSWQEPTPKEKPKERNVFVGNGIGSLTLVLDHKESLKAALPFQAETQLSASVLSGGSGVSRLHRTSRVYMCTATWMTSRRAARCRFACGSALGWAPVSQPLPAPLGPACWAPGSAPLSPGQACAQRPQNRVHVPSSSVFSLRPLHRDGSTALGLLRDKVPSGAGCCSVQGTPSSSPTLPPPQAQLPADHGNAPEVSVCSSLGSSALLSPPGRGAVGSHCCVWASAGDCSGSPNAKCSFRWSPTSQWLFIALVGALLDISLELNKQAAQFTLAGARCQQCQTVALLNLFQAMGWNTASPLSQGVNALVRLGLPT